MATVHHLERVSIGNDDQSPSVDADLALMYTSAHAILDDAVENALSNRLRLESSLDASSPLQQMPPQTPKRRMRKLTSYRSSTQRHKLIESINAITSKKRAAAKGADSANDCDKSTLMCSELSFVDDDDSCSMGSPAAASPPKTRWKRIHAGGIRKKVALNESQGCDTMIDDLLENISENEWKMLCSEDGIVMQNETIQDVTGHDIYEKDKTDLPMLKRVVVITPCGNNGSAETEAKNGVEIFLRSSSFLEGTEFDGGAKGYVGKKDNNDMDINNLYCIHNTVDTGREKEKRVNWSKETVKDNETSESVNSSRSDLEESFGFLDESLDFEGGDIFDILFDAICGGGIFEDLCLGGTACGEMELDASSERILRSLMEKAARLEGLGLGATLEKTMEEL
eukprot:CAMPEP_0183304446 /NCGR_PEP_ID=MMETSP0160_2-20130417/9532_1 /TAXON_ID=2839 ORGANISM="Odontella Sinensis, Strain Grunow 1884" /NCGR_SAMPLE_ID=MMETSP0160_2 /ASSEMBLY_ACC=CAM_ASM_000250 /LENGTH=396 /DNA_ID=CAMNT_0025467503 /DNA_START=168 /DNA_END=1355 /DNA_ORIENTATION=+